MPLSLGGNGVISGIDWAGTGGGLAHITTSTFTAAATVSVDGCFTATYDAYRLVARFTASTIVDLNIRLRVSGADDSTAVYQRQYIIGSSTVSGARSTNQTLAVLAGGSTARSLVVADIGEPFDSGAPTEIVASTSRDAGTSIALQLEAAAYSSNKSFDGFTIYPSSGTITGTVTVYGYIND